MTPPTCAAVVEAVSILVVDDSTVKRAALRAILAPLGHRIVEADSGISALRCTVDEDFAVILLDVRMPGMSGPETAVLIRQRLRSEMTPIIFVSAERRSELADEDANIEGAVDFILNPGHPQQLRSLVAGYANQFTRAEQLATTAKDVQTTVDELRLLTDATPIGIFQTDGDDRYTYTNQRWTDITGTSAAEAVGRQREALQRSGGSADLTPVVEHDGQFQQRASFVRPDGEMRVVVLNWRKVRGVDGARPRSVGTMADITTDVEAERTLVEAHQAAVASNDMQREFTVNASHELRTPTMSILGYAEEMIDSGDLNDENRGFMDIIHRNAERLTDLIDDLVVLGRAEIGGSMMQLETTDLSRLIGRVVDEFTTTAHGNYVILMTTIHHPRVHFAAADSLRLERALANLLSNALKFTPRRGVVTVSLNGCPDSIRISVTDTGPGFTSLESERIFDRFYRGKYAVDNAVKGAGLGLPIARGLVQAQNGTLTVASTPGAGATFTIALPRAPREPVASSPVLEDVDAV